MPKEIRRLAFTHSEATEALNDYCKKNKIELPEGQILHARFASLEEEKSKSIALKHDDVFRTYNAKPSKNAVILTFYQDKKMSNTYFNIKADIVTTSLIEHCLSNNIMLPKSGAKILDITEFNLCLDINMKISTGDEVSLSLEEDA